MARYDIIHKTIYRYAFPVTVSHHTARLTPLTDEVQSCEGFNLHVTPKCVEQIERMDYFGNTMQMFSVQELHNELVVESKSTVYTKASPPKLEQFDTPCGAVKLTLSDYTRNDLIDPKQFVFSTGATPDHPDVEAFGQRFINSNRPVGKAIQDMLDVFAEEFEFDPQATEVSTPISDVLKQKKGVCQDYAHLMIAAIRSCGLAARYVSGYILTEPPEGQERLEGADASHAWLSIFIPDFGWVDVDPTNRLVCGDQHVKVAYGRDYFDVSMLKGAVVGGGEQKLSVEVTMKPID